MSSNSMVLNKITNDLYFESDTLTTKEVLEHIVSLNDEVINESIAVDIAYSLLYDLSECLAMELQENGLLSRVEP